MLFAPCYRALDARSRDTKNANSANPTKRPLFLSTVTYTYVRMYCTCIWVNTVQSMCAFAYLAYCTYVHLTEEYQITVECDTHSDQGAVSPLTLVPLSFSQTTHPQLRAVFGPKMTGWMMSTLLVLFLCFSASKCSVYA